MLSSGNILADRRYAFAAAAAERGDHEGAADILRQTLDLAPDWGAAWFALGEAEECRGDLEQAAAAFVRALALDPQDLQGGSLRLARLGVQAPPPIAPAAYINRLFDQYATRFDDHLVEALVYRGPQLLACALAPFVAPGAVGRFTTALDLGCGTGLAASALADKVTSFIGVDLSPAMLTAAARTGRYAELHQSDLAPFLARRAASTADLVLAADVFVYIGELASIFAGVARVLGPGGLFAFTAQSGPAAGYVLGADLRYAHSAAYLRAEAARAGLGIMHFEAATARKDRGHDVPGWVVVLKKDRAAASTVAVAAVPA